MSEIELQDKILRHSLDILRLSAGDQARAEEILRELENELRDFLRVSNVSGKTRREIEKLIAEAEKLIDPAYRAVGAVVDTQALAVVVAEHTVDIIKGIQPAVMPTAHTLASLTKDVLIDGAPSSAWWGKQAVDTVFKFAREVRQGVVNGETTERIVQRIVGKRGEPGIMDVSRREARTLVHSSVLNSAAVARFESFKANQDIFAGVRWLSTLDMNTCLRCAALDGETWDFDKKPIRGTKIAFQMPLAHWNCRCTLSAELLSTSGPRRRISSVGRLEGDTSFTAFLARMSPEQRADYLGPGRAELYEKGKITLKDLVSGFGRELTLDELRAR